MSAQPTSLCAATKLNSDILALRNDPPCWLAHISLPSCPAFVCPAAIPHPRESSQVEKNEGGKELRVRASVIVPNDDEDGLSLAAKIVVRVEIDVDTLTYPSKMHLPRIWVRSNMAGVSRDGTIDEAFYDAIRMRPQSRRSLVEEILWEFVHSFLRNVSDNETGEIRLRFKVGDDVLANVGQWEPGKVIALWDEGYPYRIRLTNNCDMEVHAPFDSDQAVRSHLPERYEGNEEKVAHDDSNWPESARIPRHAWAHNVRQWKISRIFSAIPMDLDIYRPGHTLEWWSGRISSNLLSWLRSGNISGKPDFVQEVSVGIYTFQLLTPEFCGRLVAEFERCESLATEKQIDISRPNSMNKGGAIMSELGLASLMDSMQDCILQRIARVLFPIVGMELTHHHSFLVKYSSSEDRQLDMHTDDSDVTFNVCLGKEFVGSGLQFCGMLGLPEHRKAAFSYSHKVGRCVAHLGNQRHGADVIESGERINLISWNSNKVWRRSSGYLRPLHQIDYEAESGPPDPVCLSWTHDVDWEQYRGARPGGHVNPWCPPAFARHQHQDGTT